MTNPARGHRRGWLAALCSLAATGGVIGWLTLGHLEADEPARPAPPAEIPVGAAQAVRHDFPIYLRGLGSVQAFYAVTVRARVDGYLLRVPVVEGQDVRRGDVLAVIDPRPYQAALDQAMAQKAADEAQLTNARLDLQRYSSLARSEFASRQSVDTQRATVDRLVASLKGDDAAIEAAQLNLGFCYVTSPLDGRVGLRLVDPGNLIHATDATGIITVAQIHPISALFTLPQNQLPQVHEAMQARKLPVSAYTSDDKTKLADGELLTIDNSIDETTGTIRLKAEFPNGDDRLWPGQFINARLLVETLHDAVTVPLAAVQRGPDSLYVYVIGKDRTVSRKPVQQSYDDGQTAVIASGLAGGESVVVNGQSRLTDGARVSLRSGAAG